MDFVCGDCRGEEKLPPVRLLIQRESRSPVCLLGILLFKLILYLGVKSMLKSYVYHVVEMK